MVPSSVVIHHQASNTGLSEFCLEEMERPRLPICFEYAGRTNICTGLMITLRTTADKKTQAQVFV